MGSGASKRTLATKSLQIESTASPTTTNVTMTDRKSNLAVDVKKTSHYSKPSNQSQQGGDSSGIIRNQDGTTEDDSRDSNRFHSESVSPSPVRVDVESKKQTNTEGGSRESEIASKHGDDAFEELYEEASESDDSDLEDIDTRNEDDPVRSRNRCLKLAGRLKQLIQRIKDVFNENDYGENTEFYFKLAEFNANYLAIGSAKPAVAQPIWKDVVDNLMRQGVDEIMLTVVMTSLPKTLTPEPELKNLELKILSEVISGLFNITDDSISMSVKVCEKVDLLEILAGALLYHIVFMCGKTTTEIKSLLDSLLGLIYNCSLQYANRKRMRDVGFAWILRKIMRGKDRSLDETFTATIALAGILDEEESKSLQSEKGCLSILASWLGKAVQKAGRRYNGWSARELAAACSRLAGNDVNKQFLGRWGMLDNLRTLCEMGDIDEQNEALSALWSLAFNDYNKDQMLERENLIQTLDKLRECPDEGVKTLAVNTLWTLRDKLKSSSNQNFQKLGEDLSMIVTQASYSSSEESVTSGKHVMISYSWDNKIAVFRVHENLEKNGYRVWIDRNEMKGSIIDSIADGVENADALLMCISQKYKISKYCRAEAEYAFTRDINIIPLLMESDFKADGWLGLIKGAKKHFDFGHVDYFDVTFPTLVKELGQNGKVCSIRAKTVDEPDTVVQLVADTFSGRPLETTGHGTVAEPTANLVTNWSPEEVRNWLQEHGCFGNSFQKMTGPELLFLKNLKKEAPEYFYNVLETKLKVRDIKGLTQLVRALDAL